MTLTQISSRGVEDTLRWSLGASGTDHYTFTGPGLTGAVNDPTIYLTRGQTYIFENNSGGHPFQIQSVAGSGGSAYNTGVTNNGGGNGTEIKITVPHDSPDILYYQCTSHANMGGQFSVAGSVAAGSITTAKIADDAVDADKLANSINSAIAANTAKDLTALSASNLTSGVIPDARVASSAVTQHVTPFDDNKLINDISSLALKINAVGNASRYNTNSMSVETFQDSNGIGSLTTMERNTDGEYLSSVVNTVTNITEGFKGGQNKNTGQESSFSYSGAQSYTGIDGVSRVAGQLGSGSGYNSYNLGHIFNSGENFEVIMTQRGSYQGLFFLYGTLGSTLSSVGTYNSDVPDLQIATTNPTNFSSLISGAYYTGKYHAPVGGFGTSVRTVRYRFLREDGTFKIQYKSATADSTFDATALATLRATTDTVETIGSAVTNLANQKMMVGIGEAGTTTYIKLEVANTFADTVSATGTVISNAVTASASTTKMGVVVTYQDAHGTTTLNTDLKVFLSADNGSNFTEVTLTTQPNFATGVKMALANDVTVTAGTQLKYKIQLANQAANSKVVQVTGVSMQY